MPKVKRTGPFGLRYATRGTGVMLDSSPVGWALSAAVAGRGLAFGWHYRKDRPKVPTFKVSTPDPR